MPEVTSDLFQKFSRAFCCLIDLTLSQKKVGDEVLEHDAYVAGFVHSTSRSSNLLVGILQSRKESFVFSGHKDGLDSYQSLFDELITLARVSLYLKLAQQPTFAVISLHAEVI